MAKVRITLEFDVSNETVYVIDPCDDSNYKREAGSGEFIKEPISQENALRWYENAFDMSPSNFTPGFLLKTEAEFIP